MRADSVVNSANLSASRGNRAKNKSPIFVVSEIEISRNTQLVGNDVRQLVETSLVLDHFISGCDGVGAFGVIGVIGVVGGEACDVLAVIGVFGRTALGVVGEGERGDIVEQEDS